MSLRDFEHMQLPEGITPEEARWYSEQRQEDIDTAVKRVVRRATWGFVILALGLILAVGVSTRQNHANDEKIAAASAARVKSGREARQAIVLSGRAVSVSGCNRDFATITKVRSVFESSKMLTRQQYKAGRIDRDQYLRAVAYYDKQLNTFPLPDCREAEKVVTDDPDAAIAVPVPLYPGSPEAEALKNG